MAVVIRSFITLFLIGSVTCSVLPVEKCNLKDSACMKQAFQKALPIFMGGIPELGIEVMDVMEMDDIDVNLAGLEFFMKDGRAKGFKNAVVDNVKWDLKKKTLFIHFHVDFTVKGPYKAGGRILILPLSGEGQLKTKLKNVDTKLILDYEITKDANGKDHVVPKKYSFDVDVKDDAHFNLTNLVNGNKELSDTTLKFMNDNWKEIANVFGKTLLDTIIKKIYRNIKTFFEKVPLEDIAVV